MSKEFQAFYKGFMKADTWAVRKEGVPLELLDKLTNDEKIMAEQILIENANVGDSWQIIGLGYLKSEKSLIKLYRLLSKAKKEMKVIIAHSIYQICEDPKMIEIALTETKKLKNWYEIIDILYMLPDFNDEKVNKMLVEFCSHKEYLVSYNAKRALGIIE